MIFLEKVFNFKFHFTLKLQTNTQSGKKIE